MSISVQCPECDARIKAQPKHVGRKINCPRCQNPFTVATLDEDRRPPVAPTEITKRTTRVPLWALATMIGEGVAIAALAAFILLVRGVAEEKPRKQDLAAAAVPSAKKTTSEFSVAIGAFHVEASALCELLLTGAPSLKDYDRNLIRVTDTLLRIPDSQDPSEKKAKEMAKLVGVNCEVHRQFLKTIYEVSALGAKREDTSKSLAKMREYANGTKKDLQKIKELVGE